MSDQIPFHIQDEIMKRLPVRSLVQFRCVSKAWKSLIDSSEFIAAHSLRRHTQPHYLLLSYENPAEEEDLVFVSRCYTDDDTFPQQSSVLTLPLWVEHLVFPSVIGSSQGLLCLYGYHLQFPTPMAVLWNPSIRKSVAVLTPDFGVCPNTGEPIEPSIGFGVCPVTNDPKIVANTSPSEFMIYKLSTRKWRRLPTNLPSRTQRFFSSVVTDRFIYWEVELKDLKMIMSFDLISESFDLIDLPDSLARINRWVVSISKLRDSLALIEYGDDYNFSTVWMMEVGARKSFTKLFTIATNHENIVGFSKNGIPLLRVVDVDDDYRTKLVVYERNSEHNTVLEICNSPQNFYVHSYMETLLLLPYKRNTLELGGLDGFS
ncbi:hypothetical protein LXL04_001195 [Taraxacum kok-saghyz]